MLNNSIQKLATSLREAGLSIGSQVAAVAIVFSSTVLGLILSLWLTIRATKRKVSGWQSDSFVWFTISMGNFGKRQVEMWKQKGFTESDAKTIIGYQLLALFGPIIGFFSSASIEAFIIAVRQ